MIWKLLTSERGDDFRLPDIIEHRWRNHGHGVENMSLFDIKGENKFMAGKPSSKLLAAQDSLRGMDLETKEHFLRTKAKMLEFLGIRARRDDHVKHFAPPPPPVERRRVVPLVPRTPQVDAKRKHVVPSTPHKHLAHLGLATPKVSRKPELVLKHRKKATRHVEEAIF